MKYVLFLMLVLFSSQAVALNCERQPTCEELGYSTQNNPNCLDDGYLICPFDSNYKKCVNFSCESLGFTLSDKSGWCAETIECKGDKSYTLCKTSCIAWDSDTLSMLAESGKCKLITMKNDITLSEDKLNVSANTMIDGGGHTLHVSANINPIDLQANSGLKNLNLDVKGTGVKQGYILLPQGNGVLFENLTVAVSGMTQKYNAGLVGMSNFSAEFRGQTNLNSNYYSVFFNSDHINFTNAQATLFAANDLMKSSNVTLHNSTLDITMSTVLMTRSKLTLYNSTLHFTGTHLFWTGSSTVENVLTIGEGSTAVIKVSNGLNMESTRKSNFVLSGTADAPAKLEITTPDKNNNETYITAHNITDTLVLNNKTYHPTQTATTLISDVPNSSYWRAVP